MTTPPALSDPDALRLLQASTLFEQLFGRPDSKLERQATVAALAAVMNLKNNNLDALIYQVASRQQTQNLENLTGASKPQISKIVLQKAKERLTDATATLILLIRTYLQRVSSKLSATEFVELLTTAIALLGDNHQSAKFSLPESKRLLYIALQTFGNQLSQPIPTLGESIPEPIAVLLARLVRCQKIIHASGFKSVLTDQAQRTHPLRLSTQAIRNAFVAHNIVIAGELNTNDGLDDVASTLLLTMQLQTTVTPTHKSEAEIAEQLNQAITEFKASYQPLIDLTQPCWDDALSVSSPLFTASNFATTGNSFTKLSSNSDDKSLNKETKP